MSINFYEKLLAIIGMLIAVWGYFTWEGWGTGGAIALGLASFVGYIKLEKDNMYQASDSDKELYIEFLKTFSTDTVLAALGQILEGCSAWRREDLNVILYWMSEWEDVEHEFRDIWLEKKRRRLFLLINKFNKYYSMNTFPHDSLDSLQEVPSEWKREQPKRYREVLRTLQHMATEISKAHQDIIRMGRKRLKL